MSFFGFDPSGPSKNSKDQLETLDFEDFNNPNNGLEEEDALNDETFGTAATTSIGNDFNFGLGGSKSSGGMKPAPTPTSQPNLSYAKAAQTNVDEVLQPMASLWQDDKTLTSENQSNEEQKEKKIFSLEEIEAKLKQGTQTQPQIQPQMANATQTQLPFQIPPALAQFLFQPQIQQQLMSAVASGRFPNMEIATQAMVQMMMTAPNPMQQMMPPPQYMSGYPQNVIIQQQQLHQPQTQSQGQPQSQSQPQPPSKKTQLPNPDQHSPSSPQKSSSSQPPQFPQQKINLNSFPSIDDAETMKPKQIINQSQNQMQDQNQNQNQLHNPNLNLNQSQNQSQNQNQNQNQNQSLNQNQNQNQHQGYQQNNRNYNNNGNNHNHYNHHINYNQRQQQHHHQIQQQMENMTPEERTKFLERQQKVSKITRCSGFMTPRDKDFVTRFQLSQIVTEDPYNEDFYCQVYNVLNSSINENNMNSLAQKYLEQSGHRLGGRSKRADIALQRMQQQVSKAVTVAKERGKRTGILSKEGALGKVSFGSGKTPRKQLLISKEFENLDENSTIEFENQEDILPKEYKFSKSSRSFQLSIIEKIYAEVLKLESLERENQEFNSNELWKSLHLNDKIKTSTDEIINPFISILSFDKLMKLFNRIFHFLTSEQKIELIGLIFANLQKIDVILKGSYKNYVNDSYILPKTVKNKIELFQMTILKTLVIYLSDSKFKLVLNLLDLVINNNNALFLSTTKIGLSLITILISRLELIKQEFAKILSAQDLSQWQLVYDKLFQCLEGRLTTLFPPYLSHDEEKRVTNDDSSDDDSYIWQFLASLALAGLLSHQRIIVDEIRNEIFGVMGVAKQLKEDGDFDKSSRYLSNLNLFLNVMGLKATETDISELSEA